MSELQDQRWAVISQRGVEASALIYDDALKLMRKLQAGKIHGLCIVTSEAAKRDANSPPLTTARRT